MKAKHLVQAQTLPWKLLIKRPRKI